MVISPEEEVIEELREIAGFFDGCGKNLNADFLRRAANMIDILACSNRVQYKKILELQSIVSRKG